jgi:N-acylneuraminate cytidylyltransferase
VSLTEIRTQRRQQTVNEVLEMVEVGAQPITVCPMVGKHLDGTVSRRRMLEPSTPFAEQDDRTPLRPCLTQRRRSQTSLNRCDCPHPPEASSLARSEPDPAKGRIAGQRCGILTPMADHHHERRVVVVIPARGGSRGIPGKNLTSVGGRPLLVRAIDAGLEAKSVSRVIVSTDDSAIAATADRAGATVIDRPAELSTDSASTESALLHALDDLARRGDEPEILVLVQCTSPFTTGEDIDRSVAAIAAGADTAFTATPTHGFLWRSDGDTVVGINHDHHVRQRRQDRAEEYLETGAVYAMSTVGFLRHRHRFFGRTAVVELPKHRALEIDDNDDLELARTVVSLADRAGRLARLPDLLSGIAFDFDGVFTDDLVATTADGSETIMASRADGMGIALLRAELGIPMVVLSSETNPVGAARCRKLGLDHLFGIGDKAVAFLDWCETNSLDPGEVMFVGNDVNDIGCLRESGCPVAPAGAHPEASAEAIIVLDAEGGRGAVREIADLVIHHARTEGSQ